MQGASIHPLAYEEVFPEIQRARRHEKRARLVLLALLKSSVNALLCFSSLTPGASGSSPGGAAHAHNCAPSHRVSLAKLRR